MRVIDRSRCQVNRIHQRTCVKLYRHTWPVWFLVAAYRRPGQRCTCCAVRP